MFRLFMRPQLPDSITTHARPQQPGTLHQASDFIPEQGQGSEPCPHIFFVFPNAPLRIRDASYLHAVKGDSLRSPPGTRQAQPNGQPRRPIRVPAYWGWG